MPNKPPSKNARPFRLFRVVLWGALLVAVLVAVITFVVYRDEIDTAALTRFLPSIRLPGSKQEEDLEQLAYDPLEDNIFMLVGNGLCILNPNRLAFYDGSGRELVSAGRNVNFARPALSAAESHALAYDRGGNTLLLLSDREVELEKSFPRPILSASINRKGSFVVVHEESGFKTVAQVYNNNGELTYRVQSNEQYLTTAVLSPDGRQVAIAACSQQESRFLSRVTVYDVTQTDALFTMDFPDESIFAVRYPDNNHIAVLLETAVEFFDRDGKLLTRYSFGDKQLLGSALDGEFFLALRLGRYASGVRNELVILDWEGAELLRQEVREPILSMSAAGRFLSVLATGTISMYDDKGILSGEAEAADARSILQKSDGSALTLGLGHAKRITPTLE